MNSSAEKFERARPLRIAEYSVYPRTARDHRVQAGFTRDDTGRGFLLVTSSPEVVGELLRVRIQDLSAREAADTLARVAACNEIDDSRFELELEALALRTPKRVRNN